MNIYIYGSQNFKKDIHEELSRSNIDYKLADNGFIQDVNSIDALKELMEDNPEDVFLIDDAKIIKENLINSKIKFLKPKDGIEQKYLKKMGIDDFSVDSIQDISTYILKKMKELGIDDDEDFDDRSEIENSISDIVKDAYSLEDEDSLENFENETENDYELSDDLKTLLASNKEEKSEIVKLDEINSKDNSMKEIKNIEDFTSLEELSEDDILAAFSGMEITPKVSKTEGKEVSIKLDNPEDIKEFLSKLLNSKALEITVKVKE